MSKNVYQSFIKEEVSLIILMKRFYHTLFNVVAAQLPSALKEQIYPVSSEEMPHLP